MLTSVALTLRACWALEQVKASSWTIFKFNFEIAGDVNAYATERGWQIVGGRLQFRGADAENEEQGVSIPTLLLPWLLAQFLICSHILDTFDQVPSVQLANMAITYAREMEQIV